MTASNLPSAGPGSTKSPAALPVSDFPSDPIPVVRDGLSAWYDGGDRVPYDPQARALRSGHRSLRVFVRREGDVARAVTFLSGYPDGSSGWASVVAHLPGASAMPKLFLDYVGMGDSDKPSDYRFSTAVTGRRNRAGDGRRNGASRNGGKAQIRTGSRMRSFAWFGNRVFTASWHRFGFAEALTFDHDAIGTVA